jgi:hypothetical protein
MAATYPDRLTAIKAHLAATERNRCADCDGLVERSHPNAERCGPCQAEHDARQVPTITPAPLPLTHPDDDLRWALQEIDFLRLYLKVLGDFAYALDALRCALEEPAPGRVERRRRAFEEEREELLAMPNWRPGECHNGCRRYATHELVIDEDGQVDREPCCEECGSEWLETRRAVIDAGFQPAATLWLERIAQRTQEGKEVLQ